MTPTRSAAVLGVLVVCLAVSVGDGPERMSWPAAVVASLAAAAAVALSWWRPLLALVLALGTCVVLPWANGAMAGLQMVVALLVYQAVARGRTRVWPVAAAALVALTVNVGWTRYRNGEGLVDAATLQPLLLCALALGLATQARALARQRDAVLAAEELNRQVAVEAERRRIARDLHDVAAHHLSAIVVRNRLARRLGTPGDLEAAAGFTADTAQEALDAVRTVVQVLAEPDRPPLRPARDDLDEVVGRMRNAGLAVEQDIALDGVTLGPDVALAVVRIAQESLTNVLRHRGPGRAWLSVSAAEGRVAVTVEDDGPSLGEPGAPLPTGPTGQGLAGMRERATACGGRLEVGRSQRGGWRVSALLPAGRP